VDAVHQINVHIVEPGFPQELQSLKILLGRMWSPQKLEDAIIERLHTEANPIHTGIPYSEKYRFTHVIRIHLHGDLRFVPKGGFRPQSIDQRLNRMAVKHTWCTPAQVQSIEQVELLRVVSNF